MVEDKYERGYTAHTIFFIFLLALFSIYYSSKIDLIGLVSSSSDSFQTSSIIVLLWRVSCLLVGVSAAIYMVKIGAGNMRVITIKECEEITIYPEGVSKFVTFSSWTLLSNIAYFAISVTAQSLDFLNIKTPDFLLGLQVFLFCIGIAMAFMTATIVRHIILPDEVKIGRNHDHMFNFHEQIMHNFAAVFLAVELILVRPDLEPQFAIIGILTGILYVTFAYLFAYFGGGYVVYSFLHPKPKIAPVLVFVLASMIALFYTGLWFVSTLDRVLTIPILIVWVSLIVQFGPTHIEPANETIAS
ncbi:MAG: hypothetical protein QF445_01030 [Candidatus Poseidoniaceae archaeon]|nr:hypothetical protein [Candidatus Poseidoniaceae archaeon]